MTSWGAVGVFFRLFPHYDLLNEQPQQLRYQFRDFTVLLGPFHESGGVGDGVPQFLLPLLQLGEFLLDLRLLLRVLTGEDMVLLVRDAAQHVVLVDPLEQGG